MKKSWAGAAGLGILIGLVSTIGWAQSQSQTKTGTAGHRTATHAAVHRSLLDPSTLNQKAPDTYKAKFTTTKGVFVVEVTRAWAPLGADRFYNLVKNGFFTDVIFFRVVPDFVVQFGINGNPKIAAAWSHATIKDDPVVQSNKRSTVTFATGGPDTRTTQVFINLNDRNSGLDARGFSPFGQVIEGMDVVDKLYSGYGEQITSLQGQIEEQGNTFLKKSYPELDSVKTAVIVRAAPATSASKPATAKKPATAAAPK